MPTCTVSNSSTISCDYGCCGTENNRTCCEFTLSESVIIVICVVGALVVVAIVVALIICLTGKQKNRVTQIRPRQRRNMLDNEIPRPRRVDIPKPPPYSEAPPQYDSLHFSDDSRSNPRSTDPILPASRTSNIRGAGRQHTSRRQNAPAEQRSSNHDERSDAPPSYISIIQIESGDIVERSHISPEPGTSGTGNNTISRLSDNGDTEVSMADRTCQNSPHPSLASGRISTSMYNRLNENRALHRTVSERSRQGSSMTIGLRRLGKGKNSVSPVTIREITVHSQTIPNSNGKSIKKGNKTKRSNVPTKIPRPIKIQNTLQRDTTSNLVSDIRSELLPGAIEDENSLYLEDSPPPINSLAAARSTQRHAVLQRLQQRRHMISPTPVQ